MVRIRCNVTGILRLELGQSEVDLQLPDGARVSDALEQLAEMAGVPEREMSAYLVLIGRGGKTESMNRMQGRDTPLRAGDELTLAYVFAGG